MALRTVLCFGDSNTHGARALRTVVDRRRFDKPMRWTSIMAQSLGAQFDVISEGHPGRTAVFDDPIDGAHRNGLRMLQTALESHRPLDLVIVMLGTNDLKARFNASAHDIALGIQRLVLDIRRSDSGPDGAAPRVLLVAPVPVIETGFLGETFAGAAEKSRALAASLRDVAERQGVAFADMGQHAAVDSVDGIHLDADAHAAIGAAMADHVRASLD